MQHLNSMEKLDEDWVKLILAAKELGLSKKDVKEFLISKTKTLKIN